MRNPYVGSYRHPISFENYISKHGYDSLWNFDNNIPDYVKQELLDHFLFRYIGTYNERKFALWWKHVTQLKQSKFLELLKSELIEFDPLMQTYSFEDYISENDVIRDGRNVGETTGGNGGTITRTSELDGTTTNRNDSDNEQSTTYGSKTTGESKANSRTVDTAGNTGQTKQKRIDSAYPESNVNGDTLPILEDISFSYASTGAQTVGETINKADGESTTDTTGDTTQSRTGTDRTDTTIRGNQVGTSKATTIDKTTNDTNSRLSNTSRTNDRTSGKNQHKRESYGRGILPQQALTEFRAFVHNSNALEWIIAQYDNLFYGFYEETETITWNDL